MDRFKGADIKGMIERWQPMFRRMAEMGNPTPEQAAAEWEACARLLRDELIAAQTTIAEQEPPPGWTQLPTSALNELEVELRAYRALRAACDPIADDLARHLPRGVGATVITLEAKLARTYLAIRRPAD